MPVPTNRSTPSSRAATPRRTAGRALRRARAGATLALLLLAAHPWPGAAGAPTPLAGQEARAGEGHRTGSEAAGPAAVSPDPAVAEGIRARIEGEGGVASRVMVVGEERIRAAADLAVFYEARGFQPAWTAGGAPLPAADSLARALAFAGREGLEPSDYHLDRVRALLARVRRARRAGSAPAGWAREAPEVLADLDLLLSDAFLTYGSHLVSGRVDPVKVHPEWNASRREADMVALLDAALETGRVGTALAGLLPTHPGYARLRAALERYRQMADRGGWTLLPGRTLRPGMRDPAVALLRDRLWASDDLVDAGDPEDPLRYDVQVTAAVMRFQERHGLDADGVAGLETNALLNVPVEERIRQIELNLERWRWLPRDLGARHVRVNIAGFEAELVEGDSTVFAGRVMVGQRYRETPVFSDTITYLVLNPSWTIPPNILEVDKLPLIREDPAYLARNRIRVLAPGGREVDPATVDWNAMTGATSYRLRMDPGPENPLGRVKFMFPNPYYVYLHDTPDDDLFDREDRAFSSGCIRVERPLELARLLLRDAGWDGTRIEGALQQGGEQTVVLPRPVPVHILYWTTWVGPDGRVQFRPDVYDRDPVLDRALRLPPPVQAARDGDGPGARSGAGS